MITFPTESYTVLYRSKGDEYYITENVDIQRRETGDVNHPVQDETPKVYGFLTKKYVPTPELLESIKKNRMQGKKWPEEYGCLRLNGSVSMSMYGYDLSKTMTKLIQDGYEIVDLY